MKVIGLRTSIWQNKLRLFYLIAMIPIVVIIAIFLVLLFWNKGVIDSQLWSDFLLFNSIGIPLILVWIVIGVIIQKSIIFKFTGATKLERKENPRVYNIVENLCISRGIPTPNIGIIYDGQLNAFATGWDIRDSWIVFSKGLIDTLEDDEIEAVAAHELTHILNGDVKNMVIINVFIGAITTIGYILLRTGRSRSKKGNILPFIGLILYVLGIILLPLVNLAISRKKEFLADAGSVGLTKNSIAMKSALKKISGNAYMHTASRASKTVTSMFISNPSLSLKLDKRSWFSNILSTHPSIDERIKLLNLY